MNEPSNETLKSDEDSLLSTKLGIPTLTKSQKPLEPDGSLLTHSQKPLEPDSSLLTKRD
jgi:hypothetical protein